MSNQGTPEIVGSIVNEEIDLPPEIRERIEEAESHWLAHLEWEARLRELEEFPEEEIEHIRQIRGLFVGASPDHLETMSDLSERLSQLEQIQEDHALRLVEHFEAGLDQQFDQERDSR